MIVIFHGIPLAARVVRAISRGCENLRRWTHARHIPQKRPLRWRRNSTPRKPTRLARHIQHQSTIIQNKMSPYSVLPGPKHYPCNYPNWDCWRRRLLARSPRWSRQPAP